MPTFASHVSANLMSQEGKISCFLDLLPVLFLSCVHRIVLTDRNTSKHAANYLPSMHLTEGFEKEKAVIRELQEAKSKECVLDSRPL